MKKLFSKITESPFIYYGASVMLALISILFLLSYILDFDNNDPFELTAVVTSTEIDITTQRIPFILVRNNGQKIYPLELLVDVVSNQKNGNGNIKLSGIEPRRVSLPVPQKHIHQDESVHIHENALEVFILDVPPLEFPGEWEMSFHDSANQIAVLKLEIVERGSTPRIGEPVPRTSNPTTNSGYSIFDLTTQEDANELLYKSSILDTLESKRPAVISFSTPGYCKSAVCVPVLNTFEAVFRDYSEYIEFIHIEPYDLDELRYNGQFEISEPASEWGLQSEPWTFVVDDEGLLAAKFEGIFDIQELIEVLDDILA